MRRPTIIEVRPNRADDGEFFNTRGTLWIATNSLGYRFGGDTELGARELAEQYHNPTHAKRERGRVSHPEKE